MKRNLLLAILLLVLISSVANAADDVKITNEFSTGIELYKEDGQDERFYWSNELETELRWQPYKQWSLYLLTETYQYQRLDEINIGTGSKAKQFYVQWQPAASAIIQYGKVKLPKGVGTYWNPTDFFYNGYFGIKLDEADEYGSNILYAANTWKNTTLSLAVVPYLTSNVLAEVAVKQSGKSYEVSLHGYRHRESEFDAESAFGYNLRKQVSIVDLYTEGAMHWEDESFRWVSLFGIGLPVGNEGKGNLRFEFQHDSTEFWEYSFFAVGGDYDFGKVKTDAVLIMDVEEKSSMLNANMRYQLNENYDLKVEVDRVFADWEENLAQRFTDLMFYIGVSRSF